MNFCQTFEILFICKILKKSDIFFTKKLKSTVRNKTKKMIHLQKKYLQIAKARLKRVVILKTYFYSREGHKNRYLSTYVKIFIYFKQNKKNVFLVKLARTPQYLGIRSHPPLEKKTSRMITVVTYRPSFFCVFEVVYVIVIIP